MNYKQTLLSAALIAFGSATLLIQNDAHADAKFIAKIGHLESAKQPRHQTLEIVANLVKKRTNGEVEFKLFPSAQLGNARQMNEGVQLGTLEATVSPAAFLGGFNSAISVLDIPYLLPENSDQARKLRSGPFGKALLKSFEKGGFTAVAWWPNGFKNFTSNKPLKDISSFKGQRFRVMDSKILIEQFNSLGASAIALPFGELYTSLQNGVVDGQENPLTTIRFMKFYEVQKNLVVSEHGAMEDITLFNPAWWNKLPSKYQDVIITAFKEVVPGLEKRAVAGQKAALEHIKKSGINVRVAGVKERAKMRSMMFDDAQKAYIGRAKDTGKSLMALYGKEYSRLTNN
jgi:C4-dicarboxylate-binding protein DctP|tara:strand:+ start:1999 stop:3030 length:1032 start_codon:yes stop_codon:yes gene_type:complete